MLSEAAAAAPKTVEVCSTVFCWVQLSFPLLAGLSPFVIGVSAFFAWLSIRRNAEVARKRATLDLIEKTESTPHYQTLHQAFKYQRQKGSFESLVNPVLDEDKAQRRKIHQYLNHYELISIGIRRAILDSNTYQDWMRSAFVRDWNAASDFIQRERWKFVRKTGRWRYNTRLYENFGAMATEWSAEAIVLNEKYSDPPTAPEGPGDEALPKGDGHKPLKSIFGVRL